MNEALLEEFAYPSMFGMAEVFCIECDNDDNEVGTCKQVLRALYVDGGFQSVTYIDDRRFEAPFAYCRVIDQEVYSHAAGGKALVLGGGAFSYPKHALASHPDITLDVVEIDPVIVDIARRHFYVGELEETSGDRLRVFAQDGLEFLKQAELRAYGAIVNDCFAGTMLDSPLLGAEGLELARRALAPDGVYVLNVVAETDEGEQDGALLASVRQGLEQAFSVIEDIPCEDEEFAGSINHIFVAR